MEKDFIYKFIQYLNHIDSEQIFQKHVSLTLTTWYSVSDRPAQVKPFAASVTYAIQSSAKESGS